MKPPRDPVLRAIHHVRRANDLTPTEQIALLALWRFLGDERKAIGPTLLAHLIGTSTAMAKYLLWRLRFKGYIGSSGKWAQGTCKAADRWLTDKIQWPSKRGKVVGANRQPEEVARANAPGVKVAGASAERVAGAGTDLGVGHAALPPGLAPGDGLPEEGADCGSVGIAEALGLTAAEGPKGGHVGGAE